MEKSGKRIHRMFKIRIHKSQVDWLSRGKEQGFLRIAGITCQEGARVAQNEAGAPHARVGFFVYQENP